MHVLIGKTGSSVEVDRCTFKGDLKDDGHYIVEKILGDKSNALKIRSCKFSDDMKKSLDLDKKHDMKLIDLRNMVFNFSNDKKKESCSWQFLASIVVPVFSILLLLIVFAIIKLNRNNNSSC